MKYLQKLDDEKSMELYEKIRARMEELPKKSSGQVKFQMFKNYLCPPYLQLIFKSKN